MMEKGTKKKVWQDLDPTEQILDSMTARTGASTLS
jgi:hypothetical protein